MFHFGILFLVLINYITDFVEGAEWQYSGVNGPANWSSLPNYETCGGMAQSPIDIPLAEVVAYDGSLQPFTLNGFKDNSSLLQMINNGHTAVLNILGSVDIEGGGLSQKHRTAQLHFHWGDINTKGSEHLYNKMAYPLEMHIVNFNSKYENLTHAASQPDGLAVLGFWFKLSDEDNTNFTPLLNHLTNIQYGDAEDDVTDVVLSDLVLPTLDRYYRYQGSLTTPPCFESITWSMFEEPILLSETQLNLFRNLYEEPMGQGGNHKISNNFRPVQALNSRTITRSFKLDTDSGTNHICASSLATVLIVYFLHLL